MKLLVKTMRGLGDAFAARPTIAALARKDLMMAVETPWPEVFSDIGGLVFVKPRNVNIRCAARNIEESKVKWVDAPDPCRCIQLSYSLHQGCESIPEQIAKSAGVKPEWEDLLFRDDHNCCDFGDDCRLRRRSPFGVFRLPTIRTEYRNAARNPAPGLVAAAVDEIGGDWIHLNDLGGTEGLDFGIPQAGIHAVVHPRIRHADLSLGQLSIPTCLDLVSRARCVVTPVSWMMWAALAYQTPQLILWGGYASPSTILGPYFSYPKRIIGPKEHCWCFDPKHECNKETDIEAVRAGARGLLE